MNRVLLYLAIFLSSFTVNAQTSPHVNAEQTDRPFYDLSPDNEILSTSQLVNRFNARSKGNDSLMLLDSVQVFDPAGTQKFKWYAYKYNSKGKISEYYSYESLFKTFYKMKYDYLPNDSLNYAIFYQQNIQTYPSMNTIVTPLEVDQYTYDSSGYLSSLLVRNYYPSTPKWIIHFYYDTLYNLIRRHRKDYTYSTWNETYMYEHFFNSANQDTAMHFYKVLPDSSNLSHYAVVFSEYDSLNRETEVKSFLTSPNGAIPFRRFYLEYDNYGNNSHLSAYEYLTDINNVVEDTFYNNFYYYFREFDAIDSLHKFVGLTSNNNQVKCHFYRYFHTKQSLLPDSMHYWIKWSTASEYDLHKRYVYSYDSLNNLVSEIIYYSNGNQWAIDLETNYFYNWHHPLGLPGSTLSTATLKIKVYPNPAIDVVILEFEDIPEKNTRLQLFTIEGVAVSEKTLTGSALQETDIRHLPQGIYIFRIISPSGHSGFGKFVKI